MTDSLNELAAALAPHVLDWLDAEKNVDEFLQPEPCEYITVQDAAMLEELDRLVRPRRDWACVAEVDVSSNEQELAHSIRRKYLTWPKRSEQGRIDADGTVHCKCPGCNQWLTVTQQVQPNDLWLVSCRNCVESEDGPAHVGHGSTALEAAAEFFA